MPIKPKIVDKERNKIPARVDQLQNLVEEGGQMEIHQVWHLEFDH